MRGPEGEVKCRLIRLVPRDNGDPREYDGGSRKFGGNAREKVRRTVRIFCFNNSKGHRVDNLNLTKNLFQLSKHYYTTFMDKAFINLRNYSLICHLFRHNFHAIIEKVPHKLSPRSQYKKLFQSPAFIKLYNEKC